MCQEKPLLFLEYPYRKPTQVDEERILRPAGEALLTHRSGTVRSRGVLRRENAGMSSERKVRILPAEYPRFPE